MQKTSTLKNKLTLTTALATALVGGGYARTSYAACVEVPFGSASYLCTGLMSDETITHTGSGLLTVVMEGQATGNYAFSVSSTSAASSGFYLTTVAGSTIDGDSVGLQAYSGGSGITSILVGGDVSSKGGGVAMDVENGALTTHLWVDIESTSTISNSGAGGGLRVYNGGIGPSNINIEGNVSAHLNAVELQNGSTADDLFFTAGGNSTISSVSGSAVKMVNKGTGLTEAELNGQILSGSVFIESYGFGMKVETGGVSEIDTSIFSIQNKGTGSTEIEIGGKLTSTNIGVFAQNSNSAADLIFTSADSSEITASSGQSVYLNNQSVTGMTFATINGVLNTEGSSAALQIRSAGTGTNVVTSVGSKFYSSTDGFGMDVRNNGIGAMTIDLSGDIIMNNGVGVMANNGGNATDLNITTRVGSLIQVGSMATTNDGIQAHNNGAGIFKMQLDGDINASWIGINASHQGKGAATIDVGGNITSQRLIGILFSNNGSNLTNINIDGEITADLFGVNATNAGGTTDFIFTAGDNSVIRSSTNSALYLTNNGTGNTSITLNGEVAGDSRGLHIVSASSTQALGVITGGKSQISGSSDHAIFAHHKGAGVLTLDLDGAIVGDQAITVWATNEGDGGIDLIVRKGAGVSNAGGGDHAIEITNDGAGDVTAQIDGKVQNVADTAVRIRNNSTTGSATRVDVSKTAQLGGLGGGGLVVENYAAGGGATDIFIDGDVTGNQVAVFAEHKSNAADLTIEIGANAQLTSGAGYGVLAMSHSAGKFEAVVDGKIDTYSGGLRLAAYGDSGVDLTVSKSAQVTVLNGSGIGLANRGAGDIDAMISGNIAVSGHGALLENMGVGNLIATITSDAVISSAFGIGLSVRNDATANDVSISIDGDVSGGMGGGLIAQYSVAGTTDVVIGKNANISGTNFGFVLSNYGGVISTIDIANGATISGGIGLGVMGGNTTVNTAGTLRAVGGGSYALAFNGLTDAANVNILGGRIVGDVVDGAAASGFSNINVVGDFTSEGHFDISSFTVAKGGVFTAGQGTWVNAATSAVDILGTFRVTDTAFINGGMSNRGQLVLGSGSHLKVDTMSAATGTITLGVDSVTSHGLLTITGGPADMTNQTVLLDIANTATFNDGDQILVIDGKGAVVGGPDTDGIIVGSNSPLWDMKLISGANISDDSDLFLVMSKAAPQAQIQVDGAIVAATLTFADTAMNLTGERLSLLRRGVAETGVSAGGYGDDKSTRVWAQALGQHIDQKNRKGVAGYDANLYGGSVGMDTDNILKDGVIGVAFSYGQSKIRSHDMFNSRTDIDSYQLTFYGDYNWQNGVYVEGMGAYAFNKNDKIRHNAGGAGLDASSTFDSHNVAMRGETGRTFSMGAAFVTPFAMANWLYYTAESYSETGAGLGNLHVKSKDLHQVDLGVGAKLGMTMASVDGSIVVPELHAVYRRDMLGDKLSTTQSYVAGGGPTVVAESPDPARDKLTLGARVKYFSEGGFELTAAYDFDIKEDFTSHTGLLRAGWAF